MDEKDREEKAYLILLEFYQYVHEIFLGYFVSLAAPRAWRPHLDKYVKEYKETLEKELIWSESAAEKRVEEQDHVFSDGEFRIQTTTVRLRKLLAPGVFENLQAKNAIKLIYDSWENTYRPQLEDLIGEKIQGDIWGDLRYLRESITHRNSRGIDKIIKSKIIKNFIPGQEIVFTHEIMAKIQQEIENWYYEFQKYRSTFRKEVSCQNKK